MLNESAPVPCTRANAAVVAAMTAQLPTRTGAWSLTHPCGALQRRLGSWEAPGCALNTSTSSEEVLPAPPVDRGTECPGTAPPACAVSASRRDRGGLVAVGWLDP